jgi:hypothetical protein
MIIVAGEMVSGGVVARAAVRVRRRSVARQRSLAFGRTPSRRRFVDICSFWIISPCAVGVSEGGKSTPAQCV